MRRNRGPALSSSLHRARAHQQAQDGACGHGGRQTVESISSLLRSYNVETNPARPMRPSPLTASTISDMPLDLVDRIRSFPFFVLAPEAFLSAIVAHLRPQVHSAHDRIITEGDEAKAMYWLVRGVVAVTSRDGEAVYAELKSGAFFGEIGVLMNIPRTATIVARIKCLLVVLKKEDLQAELLGFPEMEKAIRQEAEERLNILNRKRRESGQTTEPQVQGSAPKLACELIPGNISTGDVGAIEEGTVINNKKRKSPSLGLFRDPAVSGSALASGHVNIRKTLTELPLFSTLPSDLLHMLGLSARLKTYPPFANIIRQGATGQAIFFIVRGEAEAIHEMPATREHAGYFLSPSYVRVRLKEKQYFGEVASLGLTGVRTATVRAITKVECLMIPGEAVAELLRLCPAEVRAQVEETARRRYHSMPGKDVAMTEDEGTRGQGSDHLAQPTTPPLTYSSPLYPALSCRDEADTRQASDPDPFLSVERENMRSRRRNSLAPPTPPSSVDGPSATYIKGYGDGSPLKYVSKPPSPPEYDEEETPVPPNKRARTLPHRTMTLVVPRILKPTSLPDNILVEIFTELDLLDMIRMRAVCTTWRRLLCESPRLCVTVDLASINRMVTDWSLVHILTPFIGPRPLEIDISNCFHMTDEGFQALWKHCGMKVKIWRMRSVWDVSAGQILEMSENARDLEEVDWSNCRKVGDNLLARVVGWVVPEMSSPLQENGHGPAAAVPSSTVAMGKQPQTPSKASKKLPQQQGSGACAAYVMPAPGTVIGCPGLRRLNLSYCKHITDRSMMHLAAHASSRIESLTLTRCTSISDHGFQAWGAARFDALTHLCLADCTYLTDASIVALASCAKQLQSLDLSFCCALSDTATEVVAMELPMLRELRLAFCGSAVSDASLGYVALHLDELRGLSVRGCVRVTGSGVEPVLQGCGRLEWLDVSQCKNLAGWLVGGGVDRWGFDEREKPEGADLGMLEEEDEAAEESEGEGDDDLTDESMRRAGLTGPAGWVPGVDLEDTGPTTAALHELMVAGPPLTGAEGVPRILPSNGDGSGCDAGGTGHGKLLRAFCPSPGPPGPIPSIVAPSGITSRRTRKPVRFIIEKGAKGLR